MVQIGNTKLPGTQTTVESSSSVGVNVGSPGNVGIVGAADLSNGTAQANELHAITTPVKARKVFGDEENSPLTVAVIQALSEGAYPVHAVPAADVTETQDISGAGSTSIVLNNAPAVEDASTYTVTVDGVSKTTYLTYDDPASKSVADGEAYVNSVHGEVELDAAPGDADSTNDTIEYTYYDYQSAIDKLEADAGHIVDFIGATWENDDVTLALHDAAGRLESQYNFTVTCAGAGTYISDFANASANADSSRLQEYFPLRNEDEECAVGALLGLRARLGMRASPMNKSLRSVNSLRVTLSRSEQENLTDARINPIADEGTGARVVDDMTTVTDSNSEEANWRQGISRVVTDYVTETVNAISKAYIGQLHTQAARNSLRGQITGQLKELMRLSVITGFTVNVEEVDAMTASVDVGIETVDPLRNIVATVTAGEVN